MQNLLTYIYKNEVSIDIQIWKYVRGIIQSKDKKDKSTQNYKDSYDSLFWGIACQHTLK